MKIQKILAGIVLVCDILLLVGTVVMYLGKGKEKEKKW